MPAFGSKRFTSMMLGTVLGAALAVGYPAYAAEELSNLEMFKGNGAMQSGQWRMEMLSSNDTSTQDAMGKMGKMSICVDMAKQLAKNANSEKPDCNVKVLRNTASVAEIESSCKSGSQSHVVMTRESKDSYLIDGSIANDKSDKPRTFKARYTYEGACKGDSMIQVDKQSEACQKMKAQMQGHDMVAMCASTPEQYRAQCEQRMKQMQSMCQ